MPRLLVALAAVLVALSIPALASAAVDPAEWNNAVDALHAVDPTIAVPDPDPTSVTVVGGGTPLAGSSVEFGLAAQQRGADVSGTMVQHASGTTFRALPVCVAAAPVGSGAIAAVVGQVVEPEMLAPTLMLFDVTDGGLPGAQGDAWNATLVPLPLSPPTTIETLCMPRGSANQIEGSIVVNVP